MTAVVAAFLNPGAAKALDCPNLNGTFGVVAYTDSNGTRAVEPSKVKIHVTQAGCAVLTISANRVDLPEEQVVTNIRTDGIPTLYIARPEDSDGPEEYLFSAFSTQALVSKILYLYEGPSRKFHDTGAALTYDLDESGNLREVLLNPDGQGGMRIVESFRTQRE